MTKVAIEQLFNSSTPTVSYSSYNSANTVLGPLIQQQNGGTPDTNYAGPMPIALARPNEQSTAIPGIFPSVISWSSNIDWVFLADNAAAAATRRIVLYTFNRTTNVFTWMGFITLTYPTATTHTIRGLEASYVTYSTGTVSNVSGDSSLQTLALNAGGATYAVGDYVTLASTGGTTINNAVIKVLTLSGSAIATFQIINPGLFSSNPTAFTQASTTGSGSGATFQTPTYYTNSGITGTGTAFQSNGMVPGNRIGFGSTIPSNITTWYTIEAVNSDTSLTLTTTGPTVTGSSYVIENLSILTANTNATAANGGLFMAKGLNFNLFTTTGTTIPSAGAIDNLEAVYWLADAATETNTASSGLEISPVTYDLTALSVNSGGSGYNPGDTITLTAVGGTMTTAAVLTVNTVSGSSVATFTISTPGVFTSQATSFTQASTSGSGVGATFNNPTFTILGQTAYILDTANKIYVYNTRASLTSLTAGKSTSAWSFTTGVQVPTGTISQTNNGALATMSSGPGSGVNSFYFVTTTRIYRCAISGITSGSTTWQTDSMVEIPPGSTTTFAATGALSYVVYDSTIDRLVVMSTGTGGDRSYVTKYNTTAAPMDNIWLIDSKQQDQSTANSGITPAPSIDAATFTVDISNGIYYMARMSAVAATNQVYAVPASADWSYAGTTNNVLISPAISTPSATQYYHLWVNNVRLLGTSTILGSVSEPYAVYYRTSGISGNTGTWNLLGPSGDLSAVTPASQIQFMFEFRMLGNNAIPAQIIGFCLTYEQSNSILSQFEWNLNDSSLTNGTVGFTQTSLFTGSTTVLSSGTVNTAGSGYNIGDTITLGVLQLSTLLINAAGAGYNVGDTITLAAVGGNMTTPAVVTVNTLSGSGVATFTITNPGVFTSQPTSFTQASTSGAGAGATFKTPTYSTVTPATMTTAPILTVATLSGSGVATFTISNPGVFTSSITSFVQASTSGAGSGFTLTSPTYVVAVPTLIAQYYNESTSTLIFSQSSASNTNGFFQYWTGSAWANVIDGGGGYISTPSNAIGTRFQFVPTAGLPANTNIYVNIL